MSEPVVVCTVGLWDWLRLKGRDRALVARDEGVIERRSRKRVGAAYRRSFRKGEPQ